jgi:electron-transferring-flavoprotein dehydrogenase
MMLGLKESRNFKGGFKTGLVGGLLHGFVTSFITKGKEPWSLKNDNTKAEGSVTGLAKDYTPIEYPKADGVLTFDILENL